MAGVKFSETGAKRIVQATRFVEKQFRNPPPDRYLFESSPGRKRWFSLAERLDAGLTADAYAVDWDETGDGDYSVLDASGDTIYEVRSIASQAWGLEYEWVLCRSIGSKNGMVLEIVQGGATWHKADLETTLVAGGSATAIVTIRGNSVSLTVWDAFLSAGDSISAGSGSGSGSGPNIGITYEAEDRKWYVTEAPCP